MTENATTTASGSDAATAGSARLTPRLRLILAIVLLADVLDLMDSTITNIAAPTIVRDIGGGESLIKWLGASYALAMGVLLVVGARLGDRYGKRRMFLVGIAGFTVASLAAGLSVDPVMLITARLVQGGFGALLIPHGWTAAPIGCLVAGVALLAAFAVRQRTAADPLILPSLLANRGFTAGMLLGLAFFAAVNGLAYVISLFFQTGLGMSARSASIGLSPFMIGIIIASFVCRPLLGRLGRTMVAIGLGLVWLLPRSAPAEER